MRFSHIPTRHKKKTCRCWIRYWFLMDCDVYQIFCDLFVHVYSDVVLIYVS